MNVEQRTVPSKWQCNSTFGMARISSRLMAPSYPVAERVAHHPLVVEPGQLLGKERHALAPRARHLGDVGAPEEAPRSESVVDAAQVAVDAPVGVLVFSISRHASRLHRDIRMSSQRFELGDVAKRSFSGRAERYAEVIDDQPQAWMARRELAELRQKRRRRERDRNTEPRRPRPQPLEAVAFEPARVLRLVEDIAQAEHAGLCLPALQRLGIVQREIAQDGKAARMRSGGGDGDAVRIRIPRRPLDHPGVDTGLVHAGERLFPRVRLLPMRGARLALLPQVNMRVDDHSKLKTNLPPRPALSAAYGSIPSGDGQMRSEARTAPLSKCGASSRSRRAHPAGE